MYAINCKTMLGQLERGENDEVLMRAIAKVILQDFENKARKLKVTKVILYKRGLMTQQTINFTLEITATFRLQFSIKKIKKRFPLPKKNHFDEQVEGVF